jgi:uncharacterized delta-60 repeat protein
MEDSMTVESPFPGLSPASALRITTALIVLFLVAGATGAWDADLDLTYHSGGTSWAGFLGGVGNSESAVAVAVQTNGKVVMAGSRDDGSSLDFAVIRLGLDGFPDYTFGTGATAYHDFDSATDTARDVAIQPDGKIVVVGTATVGGVKHMGVVRFNHDGSLDGSATVPFSGPAYGLGVALQPDGKIVVCGRNDYGNGWDFALARLNPNLTIDTTFSSDGMAEWDFGEGDDSAADIAVRADGRIVVAGTAIWSGQSVFGLMVFSATGGPMNLGVATFTEDAYGFALDLQADGKAVVAGRCETYGGDFAVARFNTNATIDSSFGTGGMATVSHLATEQESAMDVVVQHNGKIVVSGFLEEGGQQYLALVRWKSDGTLDWTFDGSTAFYTYIDVFAGYDSRGYSICQQPDGKILAAGHTGSASGQLLAVARFMGDEDLIFAEDFQIGTTNWWSWTVP